MPACTHKQQHTHTERCGGGQRGVPGGAHAARLLSACMRVCTRSLQPRVAAPAATSCLRHHKRHATPHATRAPVMWRPCVDEALSTSWAFRLSSPCCAVLSDTLSGVGACVAQAPQTRGSRACAAASASAASWCQYHVAEAAQRSSRMRQRRLWLFVAGCAERTPQPSRRRARLVQPAACRAP
jgi:hypothetical protein